ncbi:MAG: nicotinamide riboside transporter PnuC [Agarilytica sp.]
MDLVVGIVQAYAEKTSWELVAVFLALAYLLLAMKESIWCWPAALVSTAIYTCLFWHVSLVMDSVLNVYYMLMAVYGFYVWFYPQKNKNAHIHRWPWTLHIAVIVSVVAVSLVSGYILQRNTEAAWPYLDSFTTWASVVTTFMVARKVLENWLYWIVIDSVALLLYIERGLYPTAALFVLYIILCVFGWLKWKKKCETLTGDEVSKIASPA